MADLDREDLPHRLVASNRTTFEIVSRGNLRYRWLHHPIFDAAFLWGTFIRTGQAPLLAEKLAPFHLGVWSGNPAPS